MQEEGIAINPIHQSLLGNDQINGQQQQQQGQQYIDVANYDWNEPEESSIVEFFKDAMDLIYKYRLGIAYSIATILCFLSVLLCYLWFRIDGYSWTAEHGDPIQIFSYHPLFMTIGFVLFFIQGCITFRILPYFKISRKNVKLIHMVFHIAAILFSSIGIFAAFKFNEKAGYSNMYSLHAWIGIGTFGIFALQYVVGFIYFYMQYVTPKNRGSMLSHHRAIGAPLLIILIGISIATGVIEELTFARACTSPDIGNPQCAYGNSYGIVTVLLFSLVLYIFTL